MTVRAQDPLHPPPIAAARSLRHGCAGLEKGGAHKGDREMRSWLGNG